MQKYKEYVHAYETQIEQMQCYVDHSMNSMYTGICYMVLAHNYMREQFLGAGSGAHRGERASTPEVLFKVNWHFCIVGKEVTTQLGKTVTKTNNCKWLRHLFSASFSLAACMEGGGLFALAQGSLCHNPFTVACVLYF